MRSWAVYAAAASVLTSTAALAASIPTPIIDNARVTVWAVTLTPGQTAPPAPAGLDEVVMILDDGAFQAAGAAVKHKAGEVLFAPQGTEAPGALASGGPVRVVVIALKDTPSAPAPPAGGLPTAFPRAGAIKVFENDRLVAWNYAWPPGVATPMHYHDKDVVIAYRTPGSIESVTADGKGVVSVYKAGEVRFNPSRRVHFERRLEGLPSAVIVELKPRS